ncbi:MAG TPA: dihydrofolate reductase family protein [Gaiellaceae bacterium]|nr:dihydrofolate reductase family protein [Gaiellaceae bacterium]
MGKVVAGITMSMDGFVAGPNDRLGAGLGDGGERLHYWVFGGPWRYGEEGGSATGADKRYIEETFESGGAFLVGRKMHDVVNGWGDDPGFGVPVFVVTHRPQETAIKGDTTFEFVTDGIDVTLHKARAAAGDKNVVVMGGADLLRQCLDAGVVDEFTLTIAPVLLGGGTRLFEGIERTDLRFERTSVIESPYATHLRYEVRV